MGKYDDIIDLEHPEPKHHIRMSVKDRAAQFAPFAALTGLDDEMKKTAVENEKKMDRRSEE